MRPSQRRTGWSPFRSPRCSSEIVPLRSGAVTTRAPYLNSRLQGYTTTIFAEMSALAVATKSINLGQGFPDTDGPAEIRQWAVDALLAGHNQYPPGKGIPELRNAVADHQRHFYGLEYDPEDEVLVTAGATEAVAATLLALCEVGDDVVMFEPFYDSYAACTAMAGANRRVVPLRRPGWSFDPADLEAAITPRTRLVMVNTPHNPTGKVFTREELELIARTCIEHDLLAVTDEVYEHLVYEGEHVPLASIPGMRERTVTISSAGKTFSFTGWKIGWACAPAPLIAAVRTVKQFLTYVSGTPFQYAVASALDAGERYVSNVADSLRSRRDLLCEGLGAIGFDAIRPSGAYFVTTDVRPLGYEDGVDFCMMLPERCGVVAIPSSVFYDDPEAGRPLVRWTFCKRREVLEEALGRLQVLAR
ncbi:MAG: aminotransferase [Acidimicrobiaceae bacterium]|jgi:N-succinyldiaminopimelate aminotransferase|nr:aminotransferase [Acidimicrobiaceae bacterium]